MAAPPAAVAALTISEAFENDAAFTYLLQKANVANNEQNRLNQEGFINLKGIIDAFPKTKNFEDTLKDLNKTFGALSPTNCQ